MGRWSSDNISSGGHVYDRTTGTWAGETKGSAGDGIDHGRSGDLSRVIHDANGPVGVQFVPTATQQPSAGQVGSGNGGSGPAAAVVNTDGPGSAGTGPGAAAVVAGPASGEGGGLLKPKLKPTYTQLQIGMPGGWSHNPKWSDTAEWEERYGEPGDWLGGVVTMGIDLGHNAKRAWEWWKDNGRGSGGLSESQLETNRGEFVEFILGKPMDPVVNGGLPPQEPVDWGR